MLILLSPAKAMDFGGGIPETVQTEPRLWTQASALARILKSKSVSELASLSKISDELAALNATRWAAFDADQNRGNARAAVFAFTGDTYQGLAVRDRFDQRDYAYAQQVLRILSGLYGVLRPLDAIQAYRLEMGTRLVTDRGANLYQWWGDRVTAQLRADVAESPGDAGVVNLASAEYFKAVQVEHLEAPVVSPRFEDTDAHGRRKVISFFAKRARGEMASWLIRQRVQSVTDVRNFAGAGYRYCAASSTSTEPVFVRSFADRGSSAPRP
jgi:uncharacterized protein